MRLESLLTSPSQNSLTLSDTSGLCGQKLVSLEGRGLNSQTHVKSERSGKLGVRLKRILVFRLVINLAQLLRSIPIKERFPVAVKWVSGGISLV